MAELVLKPIYLDDEGIFARLPDGSIVNIGGTNSQYFTVNGRGLVFDDASSTAPGGTGLTLQKVYDETVRHGEATIKLQTGKDFSIVDDNDKNVFFRIDSETGKVTLTGDLEVLGQSTVINTVIQDSDHWVISPSTGTTTALVIEPDPGVVPIVDLVTVRRTYGTPPVFRIDKDGNLITTGLFNGIDIAKLKSDLDSHIAGTYGRHTASQVDIHPIEALPGSTDVQSAIEALSNKVENAGGGNTGGGISGVQGYEHVQTTPAKMWFITHEKNTRRATVALYDDDWQLIIPDHVKIMDPNTVAVMFSAAISGRGILTLF
jgi:hypothetical protein